MFSKQKTVPQLADKAVGSIFGEGIEITAGKVTGARNVRIDGSYTGEIDIEGNLIVGESGYIQGQLVATDALVAGQVKGDLSVSGTVHLAATADFSGNINCAILIVDENAIFNGQCSMSEKGNKPPRKLLALNEDMEI